MVIIPVRYKFFDTFESEGYNAISGAKDTGNLNEAGDEAEASVPNILKLSMKSHKGLPMNRKIEIGL